MSASAKLAAIALLLPCAATTGWAKDKTPYYDGQTATLYKEAAPSLTPYAFFGFWARKGDPTDCFPTLDKNVPDAIKGFDPGKYTYQHAHTPFRAPNGLFSVTHPSLVLRDKVTGETFVLTTADEHGWNALGVHSLGYNPDDATVARALSDLNHSPIVQLGGNVWANKWMAALAAQGPAKEPCLSFDGNFGSVSVPLHNHVVQIIIGPDGIPYYVQSIQDQMKVKNLFGASVQSVATIPIDEAPLAAGLTALSRALGGHAAGDIAAIFGNLFSGNAMTKFSLNHDLGHGLSVSGASFYTLFPDNPARGLGKPDFSLLEKNKRFEAFVDDQKNVAGKIDFSHGFAGATAYLPDDHELSYSLGVKHTFKSALTLQLSGGRGPTLVNMNLPPDIAAMLVNPSTNPLSGNSGFANFGISFWPHKK